MESAPFCFMEAEKTESSQTSSNGLKIVATPIGNLRDVTLRALDILRSADLIACEDTRHTIRLLQAYEIHRPLVSLNEHNEARRIPEIIEMVRQGKTVALVSDAGMPTVSDPGQRLVRALVKSGLPVEVLPGPSAVLTALAGSGLPTMPFYCGGFLVHKKGARATELSAAMNRECTSVYFESPYRILSTLEIIAGLNPEHEIVVARELTKHFEEFRRGSAQFVLEHFLAKPPKGEITLLLAPKEMPKWAAS